MTEEKPPQPPPIKPGPLNKDTAPDNEFKGRARDKKRLIKRKIPQSAADEQVDQVIFNTSLQKKKVVRKKWQIRFGITGVIFLVFAYIVNWFMTPYQGGMAYGICKVFIENHVRFPFYLRLSTVEEFETSVRIWFTQVDAFGEYRMEPAQCYFKSDPEKGTMIDKVLINRNEVDQEVIDRFNTALPALVHGPLNLDLPNPLPDSLGGLQFKTDQFRRPLF